MACAQGFDVFAEAPVQACVEKTDTMICYPMTKIYGEGPLEFFIEAESSKYIDMRHTKVYLQMRILRPDGTKLTPEEDNKVGPINLPFHSLWKHVDMTVNDVMVTSCTPTYHLRSYLTTLLSYGADAKNTQLSREGWKEDTAGAFDDVSGKNEGLTTRCKKTNRGRTYDMTGYLHLDLCQQEHYLINGSSVMLRFQRNPNPLVVMADEDGPAYKVEVLKLELELKKHTPYPAMAAKLEQELRRSTAKYEMNRILFKQIAVPRNQLSFHVDNLFLGQQPHRAFVVMIDQDAFNGLYHKNPYHFKHNNLTDLRFNIEGEMFPQIPFKPNFEEGLYIRCYESLFEAVGKSGLDEGNGIERDWYPDGYCIFGADFTPDSSDGCTRNPFKVGKTSLSATFATALPRDIYVFVMAEFNNKIEMNSNRHVIMDYTL